MLQTPGTPRPPVTIRLRDDSPSSISLEGGDTLEPGETKAVDFHLAQHLVANGRAVVVQDPDAEGELDTPDAPVISTPSAPDVSTPDPKPARKRGK